MGLFVFIVVFLSGFGLLYWISVKTGISKNILWLGWSMKLFVSFIYVYTYSTYYGEGDRIQGDAQHFFVDSKILNDYAFIDPGGYTNLLFGLNNNDSTLFATHLANTKIWSYGDNGDFINDNRLIIRINSVIHFFSFGNIYVHVLIFSMICYIGLVLLYLAFEKYVAQKKFFLLALIFLPSIAFWGSGLTKETLTIFSLGLFFFSLLKLLNDSVKIKIILLLLISLLPLLFNKPYVGLVLFSLSFILVIGRIINWKTSFLFIASGLIIVTAVLLSMAPEKVNIVEKISYKQKDLMNIGEGGVFFITDTSFCKFDHRYFEHFDTLRGIITVNKKTAGEYKLFGKKEFKPFIIEASEKKYELYMVLAPSNSYFDVTEIKYSGLRMIATIPECLLNTLVRPFPFDNGGPLKHLSFLQNILFLTFVFWAIRKRKITTNQEKYFIYVLLSAALVILLLIGWTTPIFGAIVRYKVPAEIFILISLFILLKPKKIQ